MAIFDYNNDGLQDVFLVNGDRFDRGASPPTHYLYKNLGELRFAEVTPEAGLAHTGWGQGVCVGDFDNDGNTDLFLTQWGQNVLFRNRGNGTFEDVTEKRGLATGKTRWSTGCAFVDYNRDGQLDLFIAHYVDFDPAKTPKPGERAGCTWKGMPVICGPRGLPGETMSLYRNDGQGRFLNVSKEASVEAPKDYYGFTALTGDFDNDGWTDVYVACDSTASLFYRNKGDGTFEEIGVSSGAAYNEDGREQAGMGAAAGDFDRDGFLDIFKTNFSDDTPNLYRNQRDGSFLDVTVSAGLAVHTRFLGWGAAFLDFDNDGWKDIFVANGHVYPEIDQTKGGDTFKQQRLLYWNRRDGQFHDMSAVAGQGILTPHASRGLAVGDLDNDGSPEIVIVNLYEQPSLLKNVAARGNALLVRAISKEGRDAIGARLTLTTASGTQIDEVRSGGFHISQGDLRAHFGLGSETQASLQVRWPDGTVESFPALGANQIVTVRQRRGVIKAEKLTAGRPVSQPSGS